MDFQFHPGVNGSDPYVDFYPYTPSATAGYAFMAIFGIATLVHFVMMFPYRAAYFIPLVIGGICASSPSLPCPLPQALPWHPSTHSSIHLTESPIR